MIQIAMLSICAGLFAWALTGFPLIGLVYVPLFSSALLVALSLLALAWRQTRGPTA